MENVTQRDHMEIFIRRTIRSAAPRKMTRKISMIFVRRFRLDIMRMTSSIIESCISASSTSY